MIADALGARRDKGRVRATACVIVAESRALAKDAASSSSALRAAAAVTDVALRSTTARRSSTTNSNRTSTVRTLSAGDVGQPSRGRCHCLRALLPEPPHPNAMERAACSCSRVRPRRVHRLVGDADRTLRVLLAMAGHPSQACVIAPDVGGGFGSKLDVYARSSLSPWRKLGRPIGRIETARRGTSHHPRPRRDPGDELAATADGTITAVHAVDGSHGRLSPTRHPGIPILGAWLYGARTA
jgi:carbon-monoxide dehydrogenase large subunit